MTTRAATRRAAVLGTLAGLAGLAACDDEPTAGSRRAGGSSSTTRASSPPADPDSDLVDDAVAELRTALARARAARRSPERTAWVRLHHAHLAALEASPRHRSARRPSGSELRAAEQRLQRRLADLAVEADSGALARLLASMSAGTAALLASTTSGGART